ncbi:YwmB family TATA-box binding protein [Bacillus infantis]|uniref:YwmB family TATA-box binding protein n=1 Tax=Bacillus infantis TaxID=324767 RepID=UPI00344EBCA5
MVIRGVRYMLKKYTLYFAIIAIIGFVTINLGNKTTVAIGKHDLLTMAAVLQNKDILIQDWTIHARKNMENVENLRDAETLAGKLKAVYPDWEWTSSSSKDKAEYSAVFQADGNKKESIKILSTLTNGKAHTYLIYEATGHGWGKETETFLKEELSDKLSDIFRGNATIFSCIKGEFGDKMKKTLPDNVNELMKAFDAKEIESLKESSFISASAYSPMFAGSIESNNDEMNLQIGLRTQGLGGKTTLVVGTPIITIEY